MKVISRIEHAFADVAAAHSVDEAELRTWVAFAATRPVGDAREAAE